MGDADCHSQCAHWLRNDRVFARGAVGNRRADRAVRPYGGYKRCGERADVGIGPYGSATRSSVNGPPGICRRGLPLDFWTKKYPLQKRDQSYHTTVAVTMQEKNLPEGKFCHIV